MHRLILLFALSFPAALFAETYGEPMPEGQSRGIGEALAAELHGAAAKYHGRIGQICQTKGCWLILEDDGQWARVMTGHKFFLPKDATGRATVHGVLEAVDVEEKQARHLAEDYGGDAEPVMREYRIVASSIDIDG
ncbi:MAG TPA: DUF4920 domain-containing protein [Xanthomonadaceae bacterium]|nr:DUF4920 domain-containing protein [Xanthomonadaceae bacterium]